MVPDTLAREKLVGRRRVTLAASGTTGAREKPVTLRSKDRKRAELSSEVAACELVDVQMDDNQVYTRVQIDGIGIPSVVGDPATPCRSELIRVVAGSRVKLSIDSVDWYEVDGAVDLAPEQPPLPDARGPNGEMPDKLVPFVKNQDVYRRNAFLNRVPVKLVGTARIRGREYVEVIYCPVSYNPAQKKLKIARSVQWHLDITPPKVIKKRRPDRLMPDDNDALDARVPEDVDAEAPPPEAAVPESTSSQSESGGEPDLVTSVYDADYLIITPDVFTNEVAPLAAWKHKKGYKTYVATLSDVGAETEAAISAYIQDVYDNNSGILSFVLLVGDHENLPGAQVDYHPQCYGDNMPFFSDFPYSLRDGGDAYADVIIGRLPGDAAAQITTMVNKTLGYDKTPDMTNRYNHILVAGMFEDDEYQEWTANRWFMEDLHRVADFLGPDYDFFGVEITKGYTVHTAFQWVTDYTNSATTFDPTTQTLHYRASGYTGRLTPPDPVPAVWKNLGSGTKTDISAAINAGVSMVFHRDHGYASYNGASYDGLGWADPDFRTSDVSALSNGNKLPFVFSLNCGTGHWEDRDAFAETWMRDSNGGAVAFTGAARLSYSGPNDSFLVGVMDSIWDDYSTSPNGYGAVNAYPISWRPAEAMTRGRAYVCATSGDATNSYGLLTARMFNWFGDPELKLRTETPVALSASHVDIIQAEAVTNVTVTVTRGGSNCQGALVALTYDEGSVFETATTDASGQATLSVTALTPGTLAVTVTEQNSIPYEGTITVDTAVATPTGLTATPAAGNVALAWSAVANATSYRVKRSIVSGGEYAVIGTPTGASYNDPVANGVTYYYVVQAVGATGESYDSAEVSAQYFSQQPTWSDEFNGSGPPDPANWWLEEGYQRNNELQYYMTSGSAWQENGNLVIEAREEPMGGYDYTSASLRSKDNYSWLYGRAQIRAQIPALYGMWPAIWTVGDVGEWPGNGECDILEYYSYKILANCAVASDTRWVGKWDTAYRMTASLEAVDPDWKTKFHIWTMQWDQENVRLYCDNILINSTPQSWLVNDAQRGGAPLYPFKQPHSAWLNLAVGGAGGDPSSVPFPQRYHVDYWRVWEGATNNVAPTDIMLSDSNVTERLPAGTIVGYLEAIDSDPAEVLRYSLVAGTGGDDNSQFTIPEFLSDSTVAGVLKTATVLDYDDGPTRSIRVRVTDIEGATYEEIFTINLTGDPEINVTTNSLAIPEGDTNTFAVKLRIPPANTVTVIVARASGDTDLSVQTGSTLYFTPANGTNWQQVVLAAAEDPDATHGTATFLCTDLSGGYSNVTVEATEIDNDNLPPSVEAGNNQLIYLGESTGWTPNEIATLAWFDATQAGTIIEAGGIVSQWQDISGNGNHAVKEGSTDITTGVNTINGLNTVTGDGAGSYLGRLRVSGVSIPADHMVFIVANVDSASLSQGIFQTTGTDRYGFYRSMESISAYGNSGASLAGLGTTLDTPTIFGAVFDGTGTGTKTAFKNGVNLGANAYTNITAPADFQINMNADQAANADYGEVIIVPNDVSGETRQKLEGYLAHKWGLTNSLAADHPYKTEAPTTGAAIANLDGTVSDPELEPLSTLWTVDGVPAGPVFFGNSGAVDTTATFTTPGVYTLRLTANDAVNEASDTVSITVTTNLLGVTITESDGSTAVAEGGATDTYSVVLISEPTDDVVVNVSTPDGEVSVDKTALTFTSVDWATPQIVTVTAVDDDDHENAHTGIINHTATSSDTNYNAIAIDSVVVQIADNDNSAPTVNAGADQTVYMSSGDVPWTPSEIAMVAWFDAADAATIFTNDAAGKVSQWYDKSGNDRHAIQTNLVCQPTYLTGDSMVDNLPSMGSLSLAGSLGLDTPSFAARNIYVVTYYIDGLDSAFDGYSTLLSGPGTYGQYRVMGNQYSADLLGTYAFNDVGTYKNGSTTSALTGILPMPASILKLKATAARDQIWALGYNQDNASRGWQGHYCEWIFTDGTEDSETEQKIEGYLAHKWGLEGNLPGEHPYKNTPPMVSAPLATAELNGTVDDADGDPLTTLWSLQSGPSGSSISNAVAVETTASFAQAGVYTLRLMATDGVATNTDDVVITVSTNMPDVEAPSGLTATAVSTSRVDLVWTDNSTNETGFVIERSPTSVTNFAVIGTAVEDGTNYVDLTVSPASTYYYRVTATNGMLSSAPSPEASVTTPKLPAIVTLSGLAQTYDGTARTVSAATFPEGLSVDVTYNGSAIAPTIAGSYSIEATINDSSYEGSTNGTLIVSKAIPSVTEWPTATSIEDGQALSASVLSGGTASTDGSFGFENPALIPPLGTNAVSVIFAPTDGANYLSVTGSVDVVVTAAMIPATVMLSDLAQTYDGSAKSVTATTDPAGLALSITYDGGSVLPTNAGSYAVEAIVTEPGYSGSTNGTLVVSQATPSVTVWPSASSITVGQAVSNSVLSGGSASVSGSFSFDSPATVPPEGVYTAAVTFLPSDSLNYTDVAGSVDVTVLPLPPSAPTGLVATPSFGQVALAWTAASGATNYTVKRSDVSGSNYVVVGSTAVTNYTDMSVANGSTYYYVVSASNAGGESGNSSEAVATLQHALPFTEDFDSLSVGDLSGQNLWQASNAVVQASMAVSGQGASITSATGFVEQEFWGSESNVWMDMQFQPVLSPVVQEPDRSDLSCVFFFNTNGNPVAYDGTNAVTLTNATVSTGTWVRLTVNADYVAKEWDLYVEDTLVGENLGFYDATVTHCQLFGVKGAGEASIAIDDLGLTLTSPFGSFLNLIVQSLYGSPNPLGTSQWVSNSVINATLSGSPITMESTQYVCTGWSRVGSEPGSGATTNTSFTITEDTTLTWKWTTNYWVELNTAGE